MAWRDLVSRILDVSLAKLLESVKDVEKTANLLIASADAIYSPLKAIDAGFGEARRLASRLASLLVAAFMYKAQQVLGDEDLKELVKKTEKVLEEYKDKPHSETANILRDANVTVEVSYAPEPREAVVKSLKDYVEPKQPAIPRRRKTIRKPDPLRDVRRILRELGKINPMLAYSLSRLIASRVGVSM